MSREDIGGGIVRLTPDEGKVLRDTRNGRTYSEVVCESKNAQYFTEQ